MGQTAREILGTSERTSIDSSMCATMDPRASIHVRNNPHEPLGATIVKGGEGLGHPRLSRTPPPPCSNVSCMWLSMHERASACLQYIWGLAIFSKENPSSMSSSASRLIAVSSHLSAPGWWKRHSSRWRRRLAAPLRPPLVHRSRRCGTGPSQYVPSVVGTSYRSTGCCWWFDRSPLCVHGGVASVESSLSTMAPTNIHHRWPANQAETLTSCTARTRSLRNHVISPGTIRCRATAGGLELCPPVRRGNSLKSTVTKTRHFGCERGIHAGDPGVIRPRAPFRNRGETEAQRYSPNRPVCDSKRLSKGSGGCSYC